jgi:hypothetical protein
MNTYIYIYVYTLYIYVYLYSYIYLYIYVYIYINTYLGDVVRVVDGTCYEGSEGCDGGQEEGM